MNPEVYGATGDAIESWKLVTKVVINKGKITVAHTAFTT